LFAGITHRTRAARRPGDRVPQDLGEVADTVLIVQHAWALRRRDPAKRLAEIIEDRSGGDKAKRAL
jgi:hypothetical protein